MIVSNVSRSFGLPKQTFIIKWVVMITITFHKQLRNHKFLDISTLNEEILKVKFVLSTEVINNIINPYMFVLCCMK